MGVVCSVGMTNVGVVCSVGMTNVGRCLFSRYDKRGALFAWAAGPRGTTKNSVKQKMGNE